MEPKVAFALLLTVLYERDNHRIAAILRKHQTELPPEAFGALADYFEGKIKRRAGRKTQMTLSLAQEYGRLRATCATVAEAKAAASRFGGIEETEGRTLAQYMRTPWFREAVERKEALCRAWAETTEKIEAGGPEASREWIENCLRAYLTRAREIDPDQLHYTWLTLPSGECITITD